MTDQTTNPGGMGTGSGVGTASSGSTSGGSTSGGNEDKARAEFGQAADEARSRGQAIAEEARGEASRLASGAQAKLEETAEGYKSQAAGEINRMADALRHAGEDMRQGTPQERAISSMADRLADAADAISTRDLGSLMGDAAAFARRNPTAFLGGAALLGFAAARFAKASARSTYSTGYESGDYQGYAGSSYGVPQSRPLPSSRAPAAGGMGAAGSYGATGAAGMGYPAAGSSGGGTGTTGSSGMSSGAGSSGSTGPGSTGAGSSYDRPMASGGVTGTGSTGTSASGAGSSGSTGSSTTGGTIGGSTAHRSEDK